MRSVRNKNGFRIISMGDCSKKKGGIRVLLQWKPVADFSQYFISYPVFFLFLMCLLLRRLFLLLHFCIPIRHFFAIFLLYNPIGIFLFSCSNFRSILCVCVLFYLLYETSICVCLFFSFQFLSLFLFSLSPIFC